MTATMIAILCNANFLTVASFPVEMNSAIGRQNALAWSIDVADIYLLRWEALARSCGDWFSIAGISAASRPIAPFPGLPQDRPNLSNCDYAHSTVQLARSRRGTEALAPRAYRCREGELWGGHDPALS
jgi:hypothetical protein